MTYRIRTRYYTWRNIHLNISVYRGVGFYKWGHLRTSTGRTVWVRLGLIWIGVFIANRVKVKE